MSILLENALKHLLNSKNESDINLTLLFFYNKLHRFSYKAFYIGNLTLFYAIIVQREENYYLAK